MEVPGRKKRRKETWTPLTKKARLETPRQGRDTRLCRDATNTVIKVVEKVVKSRDQFRPHQQSNLQEYKCRCRCKTSCKFKQLNYTSCKCKKVKECKCNIQTGCVYLFGKMPNITKRYVGEAIDPFDCFRKHMKNAFLGLCQNWNKQQQIGESNSSVRARCTHEMVRRNTRRCTTR